MDCTEWRLGLYILFVVLIEHIYRLNCHLYAWHRVQYGNSSGTLNYIKKTLIKKMSESISV